MEAINASEMSFSFYQTTQCNITEDGHVHTRRRKNLKSHQALVLPIVGRRIFSTTWDGEKLVEARKKCRRSRKT
jgi:hypothetical protein